MSLSKHLIGECRTSMLELQEQLLELQHDVLLGTNASPLHPRLAREYQQLWNKVQNDIWRISCVARCLLMHINALGKELDVTSKMQDIAQARAAASSAMPEEQNKHSSAATTVGANHS